MSAHAIAKARRREGPVLTWPFAVLVLAVAAAAAFVSDVLWPSWPSEPVALDGPALPITVTGTLFGIPPAAIGKPCNAIRGNTNGLIWYFPGRHLRRQPRTGRAKHR